MNTLFINSVATITRAAIYDSIYEQATQKITHILEEVCDTQEVWRYFEEDQGACCASITLFLFTKIRSSWTPLPPPSAIVSIWLTPLLP